MVLRGNRERGFFSSFPSSCSCGPIAAMRRERSRFIKLSVTSIRPQIEFNDGSEDVNKTQAISCTFI